MKKTFAIFALCLLVLLGGVILAVTRLHDDRDDMTVHFAALQGDPAAAEGFTAAQSLHYENYLRWDLTIPLAHPENTETVFSRQKDLYYGGEGTVVNCAVYINTPQGDSYQLHQTLYDLEELFLTDSNLAVYRDFLPMVNETLAETPNNQRHSKTFLLKDYFESYPLAVEAHAPYMAGELEQLNDIWQDFFSFPIPEEEDWTITMEKGSDGAILAFQLFCENPAYSPNALWAYAGDRLFFTLDGNSSGACANAPGGFGLYAPEVVWEDGSPWQQLDQLSNVYPLPQGTEVLDLKASSDESRLLLTIQQGDGAIFQVIDPETMGLLHTFPIPQEVPERVFWGENFLLFLGPETLHLYEPDGETYTHVFSAPMEDHIRNAEDYLLRAVWNGERLAVATAGDYQQQLPGLTLSVFADGALAFQGFYEPDPNENIRQGGSYRYVELLPGAELELTWN